ncbi:hypothetical protein ACVIRM_005884 [Rhizobium laguerreae]
MRLPLQPTVADAADTVVALASRGDILQSRQGIGYLRRGILADDGDVPHIRVAVEVKRRPRVELVVKFPSQRMLGAHRHGNAPL